MIRINLLGGPKAVAVAAPEGGPGVSAGAIILSVAIFVALGLVAGIHYWLLNRDIQQLDVQIQAEKREQARLADIRRQAEAYQRTIADLTLRRDTIVQLSRSRVGPVELMRALGVTATRENDLFLGTVSHQGTRLAISGTANRVETVANFLANLEQSGSFDDVQLRQEYQDNKGGRTSFTFNIDCVFKPSAAMVEITGAPASPGGPGAAPAGRRTGM